MPANLNSSDPSFANDFESLLGQKREAAEDVTAVVRGILEDVRARGDDAVIELTNKFDRVELEQESLRISNAEIEKAVSSVEPETMTALRLAHGRIHSHHARQMPKDDRYTDAIGVELGSRWTAIEAVGPHFNLLFAFFS